MKPIRRLVLFSGALLLGLLGGGNFAHAAALYAHIEFTEGTASIVDANGQSRSAQVGDTILEGETIVTGKDGELHARTDDYGYIALRPNTKMKVETYRARADKDDSSVISLAFGALRSITGWIGKAQPSRYSVRTTTATIGIRGTDHEPTFIPPGETAIGPPETYDKVNTGATYIENQAGRVNVDANRAGFAPHAQGAAPRVLDRIPEFYRPTRNERRLPKRKEELAKEVDRHHLERQKTADKEAAKDESHKKAAPAKKKRVTPPGK